MQLLTQWTTPRCSIFFIIDLSICGAKLLWFKSYLITNRSQSLSVDGVQSKTIIVDCSVPQISVLGPLEFISHTEDVVEIFIRNVVSHHLFADDKQLYKSGRVSDIDDIRHQLCRCVTDIRDWFSLRRLQLNALKTDLWWFGSRANYLRKLSSVDMTLSVDNNVIQPVAVVRDLGVHLDAMLTMLTSVELSAAVSSS